MSALKPNGNWGATSVQTLVAGTNFAAFPSNDCDGVTLVNGSGVVLDLQAAGQTLFALVPVGAVIPLVVSANTNEIQVRRNDQSGTQVTVGVIFRKIKPQ